MSSVIHESCVIKSNSDYRIDSIEHQLKDAIVMNRKNELFLRCGRNIDATLTSIDITSNPNLGVVNKENPHPLKKKTYVGHKLKRIVARKLSNRRKRPTTDG